MKTKSEISPAEKTDLRQFACAALSGLLSNPSTTIQLTLEGVEGDRRIPAICEQAFAIGKVMSEVERS